MGETQELMTTDAEHTNMIALESLRQRMLHLEERTRELKEQLERERDERASSDVSIEKRLTDSLNSAIQQGTAQHTRLGKQLTRERAERKGADTSLNSDLQDLVRFVRTQLGYPVGP